MFGQQEAPDRRVPPIRRVRASPDSSYTRTPVVVLANRAPLRHEHVPGGRIRVRRSGGGVVTAVEPLVKRARACSPNLSPADSQLGAVSQSPFAGGDAVVGGPVR